MSEKVQISAYAFFENGNAGASSIVGVENTDNRVVRYKFRTPTQGASKLSWTMIEAESYYIGADESLRFFVGTDPNSHVNAGQGSAFHGTATATKDGSTYTITGEANGLVLLPDTDYYLFIFAGYSTIGYWGWWQYLNGMSVYLDGAAGVVRIKEGDKVLTTLPMAKENGVFVPLAATIKSGENMLYCI